MVRAHSIDALIAAAGIDAGAGFQAIGTGSAEHAAASVSAVTPVLVLAREGAGDLARALVGVLSKYAGETPVTLLVDRAGAVVGEDGGTVAAAAPALLEGSWPAGWEEVVAVALPALAAEEVRDDLRGLVGVIRRLRDPEDGCPWDLAQDHQSLRPHLLEETYEVLEALDGLSGDGSSMGEPVSALREELGDLLMQVVLQARVAEQAGEFTLGEVAEGIRSKLVRRHPHVFGEEEAETPEEVAQNWDRIKAAESKEDGGRRESAIEGVPAALPALARAQKLTGAGVPAGVRVGVGRGCAGQAGGGTRGDRGGGGVGAGGGGGGSAVRGVRFPASAGGGSGGCAAGGVREVRAAVPSAGGVAAGGGGSDGVGGAGRLAGALGAREGGGGVGRGAGRSRSCPSTPLRTGFDCAQDRPFDSAQDRQAEDRNDPGLSG